MTFNNPLKVCFLNLEISYYNPKKSDTNCKSIFLIENPNSNGFSKINGTQNQ